MGCRNPKRKTPNGCLSFWKGQTLWMPLKNISVKGGVDKFLSEFVDSVGADDGTRTRTAVGH